MVAPTDPEKRLLSAEERYKKPIDVNQIIRETISMCLLGESPSFEAQRFERMPLTAEVTYDCIQRAIEELLPPEYVDRRRVTGSPAAAPAVEPGDVDVRLFQESGKGLSIATEILDDELKKAA